MRGMTYCFICEKSVDNPFGSYGIAHKACLEKLRRVIKRPRPEVGLI